MRYRFSVAALHASQLRMLSDIQPGARDKVTQYIIYADSFVISSLDTVLYVPGQLLAELVLRCVPMCAYP